MKKAITLGTMLFLVFALAIPALYAQPDLIFLQGAGTVEDPSGYLLDFELSIRDFDLPRPYNPRIPAQGAPLGFLELTDPDYPLDPVFRCTVRETLQAPLYLNCGGLALFGCLQEYPPIGVWIAVNFASEPYTITLDPGGQNFTLEVTAGQIGCLR